MVALLALFITGEVFWAGSRAEAEPYQYTFFARLEVKETLVANCTMPCAAPRVESVYLYLHGGFDFRGDRVMGKGEVVVQPASDCTIVASKGGGSGSSCRIAGPKNGAFTVSGRRVDMVQVTGNLHAPEVSITLHPTQWPDLLVNFFLSIGGKPPFPVPVNHYQGSYQTVLRQSGLLEHPITVIAAHSERFATDAVVGKISKQFQAELELPAPGFLRKILASGVFAFKQTPHPL